MSVVQEAKARAKERGDEFMRLLRDALAAPIPAGAAIVLRVEQGMINVIAEPVERWGKALEIDLSPDQRTILEHLAKAGRDEAERLRAENERLRYLLRRYRNETPLGHQPHMIAHVVDKALEESQ